MQRMWIQTLALAAVTAVGVLVVDDAQAGHRRRGGCGSSGGGGGYYKDGYAYGGSYGGGYYTSDGRWMSGGYATNNRWVSGRRGLFGRWRGGGGTYVRSGGYYAPGTTVYGRTYGGTQMYGGARIEGSTDRTARGFEAQGDARLNGQIQPSQHPGADVEADADIRARGNVPDAGVRGRATGDADVDVNRNNGTIRGDADVRARGDATLPAPAPESPRAAPDTPAPPPVPEAPETPRAADTPAAPEAPAVPEAPAAPAPADAPPPVPLP